MEYEQNGELRAQYGRSLLSSISKDLTEQYGAGFNRNNLQYMRKLYLSFPNCTTLSCKLSWSHYIEILKSDAPLGYLTCSAYGQKILATLSQRLMARYGKGYSYSALTRMMKF